MSQYSLTRPSRSLSEVSAPWNRHGTGGQVVLSHSPFLLTFSRTSYVNIQHDDTSSGFDLQRTRFQSRLSTGFGISINTISLSRRLPDY